MKLFGLILIVILIFECMNNIMFETSYIKSLIFNDKKIINLLIFYKTYNIVNIKRAISLYIKNTFRNNH